MKSIPLKISNILDCENVEFSRSPYLNIHPVFQGYTENVLLTTNNSYDAIITDNGIVPITGVPGYFCNATWGGGFAVHRLNDNGSITTMYSGAGAANNNISNFAVYQDNGSGVAYTAGIVANIATFDFSSFYTGGTSVTRSVVTDATIYGINYKNGFYVVGDWLYYAEDNPAATIQKRQHMISGTVQNLPVTNYLSAATDSTFSMYESGKDRLFKHGQVNGEIWVIDNASMPTGNDSSVHATCYQIRIDSSAEPNYSNDITWNIVIPLYDDVYVLGTDRRFSTFDIGPCLNTGSPTVPTYITGSPVYTYNSPLNGHNGSQLCPDLVNYPKYRVMRADRVYLSTLGWIDYENNILVGSHQPKDNPTVSYYSDRNPMFFDYGPSLAYMTSTGNISYYVLAGYGNTDGSKFHVFSSGINPLLLETSGHITFGNYTLSNNGFIRGVQLDNYNCIYQPSGTSLSVYASNNSGSTWTQITDFSRPTFFTSAGNIAQVRFEFSGQPDKSSYIDSFVNDGLNITLLDSRSTEYNRSIIKLRGKS